MKCYFASPFFNPEQIEREESLKKTLRDKGFKVFSPKEEMLLSKDSSFEDRKKVFDENCKAIKDCDFVFAVTDGKDVGTIWECGYAFANAIPIMYFCETLGNNPFNVMLAESGIHVFTSRADLMNASNSWIEEKVNDNTTNPFKGIIE